MKYSHRYLACPTSEVTERLERQLDSHRQLCNHVRWDYENSLEDDKPSEYDQNNNLPDTAGDSRVKDFDTPWCRKSSRSYSRQYEWKQRWSPFSEPHSKAVQATVAPFDQNLSSRHKKKEKGYNVGRLTRQAPSDYRSVTYNQSGFDLDDKRGRDGVGYVRFSKVGWFKIRYSRSIPDHATVKQATFKKERTGEWFVTFSLEIDDERLPQKPALNNVGREQQCGY